VPHQLIRLARATGTHRIGAGGVGAHVGAALLLGHGHADGGPGFMGDADVARVVFGVEDFRQPDVSQIRLQAQGRHTGEGHGQRATGAGFGLAVQVGQAGAGHMGARLRMRPGQRRQAVLDGRAHQFVIRRVELHQIDAMAITVMAAEQRFVLIRQEPGRHQRATGQRPVGIQPRLGPASAEAPRPFLQGHVDAVQVGTVQGRRLIGDVVGFGELVQVHDGPPRKKATVIGGLNFS
jgi:hypothetical protein